MNQEKERGMQFAILPRVSRVALKRSDILVDLTNITQYNTN